MSTSNVDADVIGITAINWTDHTQGDTSLFSSEYTYSNDKYSCVRGAYFFHIVMNWFVFLSGLACLVTRICPPRVKRLHSWFGRIYILSMLWDITGSLLMNNTGLPLATLISFAAVMGGLTIGWILIVFHNQRMESAAQTIVQKKIVESKSSSISQQDIDLAKMLGEAKMEIVESKTWAQRLFSLKAAHGVLFFVSWMQIAGRIFNSDMSGEFTCHTYPVFKPIDVPQVPDAAMDELTVVPAADPEYYRLPWANGPVSWSLTLIFGTMFGAIVVGALLSFFWARKSQKKRDDVVMGTPSGSVGSDTSDKDKALRQTALTNDITDHVPLGEEKFDEEDI